MSTRLGVNIRTVVPHHSFMGPVSTAAVMSLALFVVYPPWRSDTARDQVVASNAVEYHTATVNVAYHGILSWFAHEVNAPDNDRRPLFPLLLPLGALALEALTRQGVSHRSAQSECPSPLMGV